MKLKEYDKSIEIHAAEVDRIQDRITRLDPTTDEYRKAAEALRIMNEVKQTEIRSKNDDLSGRIPTWATGLIGTVIAVLFGSAVLKVDQNGGMISPQAINLWDKVIRKF